MVIFRKKEPVEVVLVRPFGLFVSGRHITDDVNDWVISSARVDCMLGCYRVHWWVVRLLCYFLHLMLFYAYSSWSEKLGRLGFLLMSAHFVVVDFILFGRNRSGHFALWLALTPITLFWVPKTQIQQNLLVYFILSVWKHFRFFLGKQLTVDIVQHLCVVIHLLHDLVSEMKFSVSVCYENRLTFKRHR